MTWSVDGAYARCEALAIGGIAHGFGLRSTAAPSALAATLEQVHGSAVVRATEAGTGPVRADAVWERLDRLGAVPIAVRTADCVPVLLAARHGSHVAAVHAGWRGTAAGIVGRAVEALAGAGVAPADLVAAVGPSIGPCCYPVSEEVAARLAEASGVTVDPAGADLRAANLAQLIAAGIPADSAHAAPWCTACETGLFCSYRRDGVAAGRQWSLIGPSDALA